MRREGWAAAIVSKHVAEEGFPNEAVKYDVMGASGWASLHAVKAGVRLVSAEAMATPSGGTVGGPGRQIHWDTRKNTLAATSLSPYCLLLRPDSG